MPSSSVEKATRAPARPHQTIPQVTILRSGRHEPTVIPSRLMRRSRIGLTAAGRYLD
jgi:hypothetical protein